MASRVEKPRQSFAGPGNSSFGFFGIRIGFAQSKARFAALRRTAGLFNIFIVIPQLLVATVMGSIMKAFFPVSRSRQYLRRPS